VRVCAGVSRSRERAASVPENEPSTVRILCASREARPDGALDSIRPAAERGRCIVPSGDRVARGTNFERTRERDRREALDVLRRSGTASGTDLALTRVPLYAITAADLGPDR
jgi:hypothetical protein